MPYGQREKRRKQRTGNPLGTSPATSALSFSSCAQIHGGNARLGSGKKSPQTWSPRDFPGSDMSSLGRR